MLKIYSTLRKIFNKDKHIFFQLFKKKHFVLYQMQKKNLVFKNSHFQTKILNLKVSSKLNEKQKLLEQILTYNNRCLGAFSPNPYTKNNSSRFPMEILFLR